MNILVPLLFGGAFGWALHRGGLTRYEIVNGVFRFADLTLMRFLLTALGVGAFLVQALTALGLADGAPIAPTYLAGNALGGLLVGAGMALVGLCPATVVAGAAEGRLDNLLAGLPGMYAGALLFGHTYAGLMPALSRVGNFGRVDLPTWMGADRWLVVILWIEVVAIVLYAIERVWRRERRTGGRIR